MLLSRTSMAEVERLRAFVRRLTADVEAEMARATGIPWQLHAVFPDQLQGDAPSRPGDFLEEASMRMIEGPYDLVLVVTDASVSSRTDQAVAGLSSRLARVVVVSTRKLLAAPRGRPRRALEDETVRWNAVTLVTHLLGHLMGLRHTGEPDDLMHPFAFDEERGAVPSFRETPQRLRALALAMREREHRGTGLFSHLGFHLASAARHPWLIVRTLLRNRALLLPLRIPSLATAAVVPCFLLVFTSEIWDVGLNVPDHVAAGFAATVVLAATCYLILFQSLFFPHRQRTVFTEHLAVVNVTVFLTVLLGVVGLFAMLVCLMLAIVMLIVPTGLLPAWASIQQPAVLLVDKVRVAAFIGAIGVLTGSLAAGLDTRSVVRNLALFAEEP